jgi:hypothetical protein
VAACINNCRAVGGNTSSAADATAFSADTFADELLDVDVSLVDPLSRTHVILLNTVLLKLARWREIPLILQLIIIV